MVVLAMLGVGLVATPASAAIGGNCNYMEEQFLGTHSVKIPRATDGVTNVPCWFKLYDKGDGVRAIQRAYNVCYKAQYEPSIDEDGSYGPTTQDRVKQMQRREGIAADGIAGEVTRNSIKWPVNHASNGAYAGWCWEKW